MRVSRVQIKNFRLLQDVELVLEETTTVIVGRNNTGKTSLTELFQRLLSGNAPSFRLEDLSLGAHADFWKAFSLKHEGKDDSEIRKALPAIEATLTVTYEGDPEFGPLSDFIIDLDRECTDAHAAIRYHLQDGKLEALFEGLVFKDDQRQDFFKAMRERVPRLFTTSVAAIDPNDATNTKKLELSHFRNLLSCGFINAQRGLDDASQRDTDALGRILHALLVTASSDTADPKDKGVADELERAVAEIQASIDEGFNTQLRDLLPAFNLFGYPGLRDPKLQTETVLEVHRLLRDNTTVRYAGIHGITLPEAYNGLGIRNLIYILLRLLEFFKAFRAEKAATGIQLVFIEEPEAHLHPQMQEVFVRKLSDIAAVLARTYGGGEHWPVQFVLTTHSSHMANEAPLDAIRYFLSTADEYDGNMLSRCRVKDLRRGLGGPAKEDRDFLHQYMTLTRCDLLFADKAILIEGTTERLLLPLMIKKSDGDKPLESRLGSQYVATMEVGGAYAHRFLKLLEFLELRTLIITDIDTVNAKDAGKACRVSHGTGTSNGCIKQWFTADVAADALLGKSEAEKVSDWCRLAYEIPEEDGGACGRSFEDAFMLANPAKFGIAADSDREQEAWDQSQGVKKSAFAIKYAIDDTDWVVPRYIREGLDWLAKDGDGPVVEGGNHPDPAGVPAVDGLACEEASDD